MVPWYYYMFSARGSGPVSRRQGSSARSAAVAVFLEDGGMDEGQSDSTRLLS